MITWKQETKPAEAGFFYKKLVYCIYGNNRNNIARAFGNGLGNRHLGLFGHWHQNLENPLGNSKDHQALCR